MLDGFHEIEIPEELRAVAARHRQHVADLVSNLRAFGVDDRLIERSLDELIDSYRTELATAIRTLKRHCHA